MIFPFVSRERLDEAKQRIAELEADRKKLIDAMFRYGLGQAVYELPLTEKIAAAAMEEKNAEPAEFKTPLLNLKQSPKELQHYIEKQMADAYKEGRANPLLEEIDAAEQEIRQVWASRKGPIATAN